MPLEKVVHEIPKLYDLSGKLLLAKSIDITANWHCGGKSSNVYE